MGPILQLPLGAVAAQSMVEVKRRHGRGTECRARIVFVCFWPSRLLGQEHKERVGVFEEVEL